MYVFYLFVFAFFALREKYFSPTEEEIFPNGGENPSQLQKFCANVIIIIGLHVLLDKLFVQ